MHRFRSRVSVLLLLVIVASVMPIIFLEETITEPGKALVAYGILALVMSFILLMLFVTSYEITEDLLIIKVGPISYGKIKLNEISLVERSYNPLSAPASSLKRLYIKGKQQDALISPINEEDFIRLLKARNPNITINISDKDDWWRIWNWDI